MAVDPLPDDQSVTGKMGRLARLRRLYHHVVCGGTTTALDEHVLGDVVTRENLSRAITALEHDILAAMNQQDGAT